MVSVALMLDHSTRCSKPVTLSRMATPSASMGVVLDVAAPTSVPMLVAVSLPELVPLVAASLVKSAAAKLPAATLVAGAIATMGFSELPARQ